MGESAEPEIVSHCGRNICGNYAIKLNLICVLSYNRDLILIEPKPFPCVLCKLNLIALYENEISRMVGMHPPFPVLSA